MVIVAVTVSVVMPLVGAALAMVANDKERAGRSATVAVALSFAAALVLVVSSGVDGDGALAVEGLLDASVDRAAAVLLAVVMGTATVVAGSRRDRSTTTVERPATSPASGSPPRAAPW